MSQTPRKPKPTAIEGADAAALGLTEPPPGAPPGATVDDSQHLVPGADFEEQPQTEAKPWFSSLAARSPQAGVANEPPDEQRLHPADAREEGPEEP